MSLREKMAALFSDRLVEEQRKLMGLMPSLPSLEEALPDAVKRASREAFRQSKSLAKGRGMFNADTHAKASDAHDRAAAKAEKHGLDKLAWVHQDKSDEHGVRADVFRDLDTEAVDPPDADVDPDTEHGIHLSSKAHELSDLAHQAHGWQPKLDPHYVQQLHFRAHDAHDEAHGHWQHVAKHHEDPAVRQTAADISGEHADAKNSHALAMQKIKDKEPESQKSPEVYHAPKSKRVA